MRQMFRGYIINCDKCLSNKQTKHIREKMNITETPSSSFETIEIDTVGPLRISNNYRYILTLHYTEDAKEPPIRAPGASGASPKMCVAWRCPDGRQFGLC